MHNALYEDLPDTYEGYEIDTSYQTGIQISMILSDKTLTASEAVGIAIDFLFGEDTPPIEMWEHALVWWMNGWNNDNPSPEEEKATMDYWLDQWRIISAFRSQYGIDLLTTDMHWWHFMGLLSTLNECALTRVCEIRGKKLDGKMNAEERNHWNALKRVYQIETEEERKERLAEKERVKAALGL